MRASAAWVLAAFVGALVSAHAAERINDYDVGEGLGSDREGWRETEAVLPAFPKSENLVEVQAGPFGSHRYYIDPASLTLGTDGVMRYSAVVKTTGGATNVSFEGIRCDTRERKVYASGHTDGKWAPARETTWRRIERHHPPLYLTLWRDYFCPSRKIPTKPAQAIEAIKRGTPLPGGPTSVLTGVRGAFREARGCRDV